MRNGTLHAGPRLHHHGLEPTDYAFNAELADRGAPGGSPTPDIEDGFEPFGELMTDLDARLELEEEREMDLRRGKWGLVHLQGRQGAAPRSNPR